MTDATKTFKAVTNLLKARLKPLGFVYEKGNFKRSTPSGNLLTIHIQKSSRSSPDRVLATVNYGVTSRRVLSAIQGEEARPGDVWDAHWRGRIEDTNGQERWLAITTTDDAATVAEQIWTLLETTVLPELNSHAEDQHLLREWLHGHAANLTVSQRLLYLLVLLRDLGPAEEIPATVVAIRETAAGTDRERFVRAQLRMLGFDGPPS